VQQRFRLIAGRVIFVNQFIGRFVTTISPERTPIFAVTAPELQKHCVPNYLSGSDHIAQGHCPLGRQT